MTNDKKEKHKVPDALGNDELQNKDLRRTTVANKHDMHEGDGEIVERYEGADHSLKEEDTPPYKKDHTSET